MKKSILLLIIYVLFANDLVQAQELYFSVSGQNVKVESGNKSGFHELWIRPAVDTTKNVELQIYDAAIGGFADHILGSVNTETSYKIFKFDDLYAIENGTLISKTSEEPIKAIDSLFVKDEQKYLNRWVVPFQLKQREQQGWIIRIKADDGNDVNNFKVRFVNGTNELYQLISLDLSIGLYKMGKQNTIQLKPFFEKNPGPIVVKGEEDSKISILDAFGEVLPNQNPAFQAQKFGIENNWALNISGTAERLNNMNVSGVQGVIPWVINPVIKQNNELQEVKPLISILEACDELELSTPSLGFEFQTNQTIWIIEAKRYTGSTIKHKFTSKGTVPVTVVVPIQGRIAPQYQVTETTVFINQPPIIQINEYKKLISPDENIELDASGTNDPDGQDLTYAWFVNGTLRSTSPIFDFYSTTSGVYSVRLLVNDNAPNSACTMTDSTISIRVNTQPYAEIDLNEIVALGSTTEFKVISDIDSDNDDYQVTWSIEGLLSTENDKTVRAIHEKSGMFTATLRIDDGSGTNNAVFETRKTYKVNDQPIPRFDLPVIVAPNQPVQLDGTRSSDPDDDDLRYFWFLDGKQISAASTHSFSIEKPGLYQISLRVNDQQGVSNSVQQRDVDLRVNEEPIPVITMPSSSNEAKVLFQAKESEDIDQEIISYAWDFGDGNKAQGDSLIHEFKKPGTYTVSLTVDDGTQLDNSIQSVQEIIKINKNPIANFIVEEPLAPGVPFIVDAIASKDEDGEISSYRWAIDGVEASTGESARLTISEPGDHIISLKVMDNSGFATAFDIATKKIHINYAPEPIAVVSPSITEPGIVTTFDASQTVDRDNGAEDLTFTWKFHDGIIKTGVKVEHTFQEPGSYTYSLEVEDNANVANSKSVIDEIIRVNAPPILVTENEIISNTTSITLDASKSYDADSEQLDFKWILPDGSEVTKPIHNWIAPEPGFHKIALQINDNENRENSLVTRQVDVIINRPVIAQVDSLIEACTGQIIIFSSANCYDPDGDQFTTRWSFGDGNSSSENNPDHTYEKPGLYQVELRLDDGISDEPTIAIIPVKINGSPTAKMNIVDTTICVNTPITLNGSSSVDPNGKIGAYSWNFGDEEEGFGESVNHLYSEPGTYNVVLTVIGSDAGICSNVSQTSATITVVEGPRSFFTVPKWVNPNQTIQLDGSDSRLSGDLIRADWTIMLGDSVVRRLQGLQNQTALANPGTYKISLELEVNSGSDCNESVYEQEINVNYSPLVSWNLKSDYPQNTPILISANSSKDKDGYVQSFSWTIDGEEVGNDSQVQLFDLENGNHSIELEIRDNSNIASGVQVLKGSFFVNAPPVVQMDMPTLIYWGEEVKLNNLNLVDADNDSLFSDWYVDGTKMDTTVFKAQKASYRVKLVQDDNRDMVNSKDSLETVFKVNMPPNLTVDLPRFVIEGYVLNSQQFYNDKSIKWLLKDNQTETIILNTPVNTSFSAVWIPRDSILLKKDYIISVLPSLEVIQDIETQQVDYNRANPFIYLTAPDINRLKSDKVIYEWKSNGKTVAWGEEVKLDLEIGFQSFELIISDVDVAGSKPLTVDINVNAN